MYRPAATGYWDCSRLPCTIRTRTGGSAPGLTGRSKVDLAGPQEPSAAVQVSIATVAAIAAREPALELGRLEPDLRLGRTRVAGSARRVREQRGRARLQETVERGEDVAVADERAVLRTRVEDLELVPALLVQALMAEVVRARPSPLFVTPKLSVLSASSRTRYGVVWLSPAT